MGYAQVGVVTFRVAYHRPNTSHCPRSPSLRRKSRCSGLDMTLVGLCVIRGAFRQQMQRGDLTKCEAAA